MRSLQLSEVIGQLPFKNVSKICSFLEYYCYKAVFVHIILSPQKDVWAWHKCAQNISSSEFDNNFYQAFHFYNNATFILFLH